MNGQELIDLTNQKLGGYQNAVDPDAMLAFINEGKDAVWAALKAMNQEYFIRGTQNTDPTADAYFPVLTTDTRDYTLPADLREIKFIEVLNTDPSNQDITFEYRDITDPDYRIARTNAGLGTASMFVAPSGASGLAFHTLIGVIDGVNATFTLDAVPPTGGIVMIFRNGIIQTQGVQYTLTGVTVTFQPGWVPQPGVAPDNIPDTIGAIF